MITEYDIDEAIAKCMGDKNPTNSTCVQLAAFLTIKEYLFSHPEPYEPSYSSSDGIEIQPSNTVDFDSNSEFFKIANGMELNKVWAIVEELIGTIEVINPRLYAGVIRKLQE